MSAFEFNCNLCGNNDFRVIEKDESPYLVLRCNHCTLVFVIPQPDVVELKGHYGENYYSEWINRQKNRRVRMWQKRLNKIQRIRSSGSLLDVGCGEGLFLRLAQANGWEISGTELSSFASKFAAETLKTDIYCGGLHEAAFADNSYDVVTMWHVLEHVENPRSYLTEVHRLLKPNGILVVAVPNVDNLLMKLAYKIIKRRSLKLFSINAKEIHLYHFSPQTLSSYLDKTGFDCLRLSPDYGIVHFPKKLINWISVIPYYIAGFKIFNAIETLAIARK